jgi:hypothetical protein
VAPYYQQFNTTTKGIVPALLINGLFQRFDVPRRAEWAQVDGSVSGC